MEHRNTQHNSNSFQIPCAIGLKSFTVSKFCMVEKLCWFTMDFNCHCHIVLCTKLYNRRKSIYCHQMRSDVSYVNILMVNSEHTCAHSRFLVVWSFDDGMRNTQLCNPFRLLFFAHSFFSFSNQKLIPSGWIADSIIIYSGIEYFVENMDIL